MRTLTILSGMCLAAAGVLAVAALVSQSPPKPAGPPAGPPPQVEFLWSVPSGNSATPRVAIRGSELQTEITPARHHRNHHEQTTERRRSKHQHRQSDFANISASAVSEGSAPASSSNSPATAAVAQRLRKNLSDELFGSFNLFLYVSKAASGPLAQRMYVFQKNSNGGLDPLYSWPVSTGRDHTELNAEGTKVSSLTPTGYFKLDPHRFYLHHTSSEWREPMPFAMFFDYVERGKPTGLAIHAATGSGIAALGRRSSAGCVRLSPDDAETLFALVHEHYRGLTPRFAVDHRTGTMSSNGIILRDAKGRPELNKGYKVLVVIDNYGGENLVAALY